MRRNKSEEAIIPSWLLFSLPVLLGFVIYLPVIRFPLFYDSLLNNRIIEHMTVSNVWLPSPDHTYYRPLFFLTYILFRDLSPQYPAAVMHGINLLQHAGNSLLLMLLFYKTWKNRTFAIFSGLLFAVYPLSYQDVSSFASTTHLLGLNLILGGLCLYATGIASSGRTKTLKLLLARVLGILAFLTHEFGLVFGVLSALIDWSIKKPELKIKNLKRPWLVFIIIDLVLFGFYMTINTSSAGLSVFSGRDIFLKSQFVFQGLLYPFVPLLANVTNLSATAIMLTSLIFTTVIGILLLKNTEYTLPAGIGLFWWITCSSLIIFGLGSDYVLHSPRLLYIPSVGIALFWAAILKALHEKSPVFSSLLLSILIISSSYYLNQQIRLLEMQMDAVEEMTEITNIEDNDQIIFINLPEWVTPAEITYPAGIEFTSIMGPHLFIEELVWINTGDGSLQASCLLIPDILGEPESYHYDVYASNTLEDIREKNMDVQNHVITTLYEDNRITSEYNGFYQTTSPPSTYLADFQGVKLIDARLVQKSGAPYLELTWYMEKVIDPNQSIFIHQLAGDGSTFSQADGPILGFHPESLGASDDTLIIERRLIQSTEGEYHFRIGIYNYISGETALASDNEGNTLTDNALMIELEPVP